MMYILSGDPREVEKVIRENRIRVDRGVIEFTPYQPATDDVKDDIADDTKEIPAITPKKTRIK